METQTRRGVLATLGIAATAGCSGLAKRIPVGEGNSPVRGDELESTEEVFTLSEGEFRPFKLSFDSQAVLLYSVVAEEKVDIIAFHRPHFRKYRDSAADKLPYIDALSHLNTRATARGSDVTDGNPVLVIDNTTWGEAAPKPNVQIEIELEAFKRAETG